MAKQTRPFIVEIKPSRKTKPDTKKTSIWGSLDLKPDPALDPDMRSITAEAAAPIEAQRS
ncbi:hypothetical protein J2T09_004657 [Neorhizobium huautlense]|uniref:Uncharacterized protein n=1 Tax=Neorhizobium huautlense TaxID=67774 RepID=A0ABT9PZI7_9HYPH|nr:hypothetical protein [Neorhizobium huautlense]MDP9839877.1 hypothetical protein [Neorhizobium huautlense]